MSDTAPTPPPASKSPMAIAMARFRSMRSAQVGMVLIVLYILGATYAPLITNNVAFIWWGDDGLSFPLIADLFNKNTYEKPHHLLFNCFGLLLPLFIVGWWALGRFAKWTSGRRLWVMAAVQLAAMIFVSIPLSPGGDGQRWRAIWDERIETEKTYDTYTSAEMVADDNRPFALFAPVPHPYTAKYTSYKSPGTVNEATQHRFLLGTDDRGADVFARMLFGGRVSLTIGIVAIGLSMIIGIVIGAISGYFGGWIDLVLQRMVEIMMAFPTFILVLVVVAMWGRDIYLMMIVFGITGWAGTARLVRGEFLAQAGREYVLAGEALGLPRTRLMFKHILPNTLTPLMISGTFGIAGMVLAESGLAFIGMGDDSVPSWGALLDVGRQQVQYAWLIWVPGVAIFGLISALNLLGNALREALDPRGLS